jgi:pimeloyl-ACP methyl ester carboxylesterase
MAAALVLAPAPAPDPALEAYARPHRQIEVAPGRRLHIFCQGEGTPTVILTAGLGQWSIAWSPVHSQIARTTRVCAWDRAGFGFSDASGERQTLKETSADLLRLLDAAGIDGPYVLVGHSAGGFESMILADRHPDRVAGMVLVDSTVPDQARIRRQAAPGVERFYEQMEAEGAAALRRCIADLRSGVLTAETPDPNRCFEYPPAWPAALKEAQRRLDADPARLATTLSLLEYYWGEEAWRVMIDPRRHYRDLPLIVLTAGERSAVDGMPAEAVAQFPSLTAVWNRSHDALAALSTRGENRIVAGAGHSIQRHRPDMVIAAVREVVDAARRR